MLEDTCVLAGTGQSVAKYGPPLGTDDSPSLNTAPQKCGHTLFEGPSLIKDLGVTTHPSSSSVDREIFEKFSESFAKHLKFF